MTNILEAIAPDAPPPPDPQETIRLWRQDPVAFVEQAFGATPELWQAETLRDLATNDRITIKSGHGVGKSTLLAWVLLWFLATRYPSKIACTAPTAHQLFDVLWAEVNLWLRKMPDALRSEFEVKSDRIELKGAKSESFAVARTSRKEKPEALQGFHSENMMFLIDEASGIEEIIFEVAQGALSTEGAKIVLTGNPTRSTGYFYRSHQSNSTFIKKTVSCYDSTRVSRAYIEEMREAFGEDSNAYRVRVLGEFPTTDDDAVIPREWVEEATTREVKPSGPKVWGLDPARFGNDTSVLIERQGKHVDNTIYAWNKIDTMELVGRVVDLYYEAAEPPDNICVDTIGIGSGVYDRLAELGLPVLPVNVAELPSLSGAGMRLRDDLWLEAKQWFSTRDCQIPNDERLVDELTMVKIAQYTSTGKIKVQGKDEIRKQGFRSPDYADAFCLTFAYVGAVASGVARASSWSKPLKRNLKGIV